MSSAGRQRYVIHQTRYTTQYRHSENWCISGHHWTYTSCFEETKLYISISVYSSTRVLLIFNPLRPRRNRRHFTDDIFKCILLNETVLILIKISLKLISKGPINNIPALVQIMAWRRPGDKPLSEPMMIISLTHMCVTRPQWVKCLN